MKDIILGILIVFYLLIVTRDLFRNRSCITRRDLLAKALPVLILTALSIVDALTGDECGKMMRLSSCLFITGLTAAQTPTAFGESSRKAVSTWIAVAAVLLIMALRACGVLSERFDVLLILGASVFMSALSYFTAGPEGYPGRTRGITSILSSVPALLLVLYIVGAGGKEWVFLTTALLALGFLMYVSFNGFFVIHFSRIKMEPVQEIVDKVLVEVKPDKQICSKAKMDELYEKLETYMIEKEPFLDENLTLTYLASELLTNKTYLSKTINTKSGMNFCQYVNRYRVNYAVGVMKKDKRVKVIEVAMVSGFHSVSTFNLAFRIYMKDTPSEYMRTLQATGFYDPKTPFHDDGGGATK